MTHFRVEYAPDPIEPGNVVEVEVLVAFHDGAPLRHAGSLRLHANEANALDRVMQIGASLERPASTYEICAREPLRQVAVGGRR